MSRIKYSNFIKLEDNAKKKEKPKDALMILKERKEFLEKRIGTLENNKKLYSAKELAEELNEIKKKIKRIESESLLNFEGFKKIGVENK